MSAGIAAILPSIVSGSTFATRRINNGANADNIAQTTMNLGVATGQIERAAECTANIARVSKGEFADMVCEAERDVNKAAKEGSFLRRFGKTAKFIGDHVNAIIGVTSGVKIITSEDPLKESMVEIPGLVLMLYGTEPLWKNLVGMADHKRENGKLVTKERKAWYENSELLKKQAKAASDYCATKKLLGMTLKHVPAIAKGAGLVVFSIAGYQGGRAIGKTIADTALPN